MKTKYEISSNRPYCVVLTIVLVHRVWVLCYGTSLNLSEGEAMVTIRETLVETCFEGHNLITYPLELTIGLLHNLCQR